jgi:hypothetical protein
MKLGVRHTISIRPQTFYSLVNLKINDYYLCIMNHITHFDKFDFGFQLKYQRI